MVPSLEPVNPEIVSLGYWKLCAPVESAHVLSRLTDGVIVTEMVFKLQGYGHCCCAMAEIVRLETWTALFKL
jgi:hypothetical protein